MHQHKMRLSSVTGMEWAILIHTRLTRREAGWHWPNPRSVHLEHWDAGHLEWTSATASVTGSEADGNRNVYSESALTRNRRCPHSDNTKRAKRDLSGDARQLHPDARAGTMVCTSGGCIDMRRAEDESSSSSSSTLHNTIFFSIRAFKHSSSQFCHKRSPLEWTCKPSAWSVHHPGVITPLLA